MGNTKAQDEDNGRGKSKGKPSAIANRQSKRMGSGRVVDYGLVTPGWLVAATKAVADAGGAIQFGYSRDGGVYTVIILMDGEIEKNYVKANEGLDEFLEGIYNDFSGAVPSDVVG